MNQRRVHRMLWRNLGLSCFVCFLFSATAAHADCTTKPGNEVGNCGLEDPLGMTWTIAGSTVSRTTSVQRSGVASLQIDVADPVAPFLAASGGSNSACFALTADMSYGRGAFIRLADPRPMGATPVTCSATLVRWSDPVCTGSATQIAGVSIEATTSWQPIVNTTNEAATDAQLLIFCNSAAPTVGFTIYADDMFAGPSLLPVELQSFEVN